MGVYEGKFPFKNPDKTLKWHISMSRRKGNPIYAKQNYRENESVDFTSLEWHVIIAFRHLSYYNSGCQRRSSWFG